MNQAVFQNLLRKHQDRVFSHAYYFLRNREDAEDVTQEVFVKLWNHGNYVDENKAHAWLMRVTHNQCVDCYRRRIRIRHLSDASSDGFPGIPGTPHGAPADPESEYELSEIQQALLAAMQQLPLTTRTLLLMHYFEDLSMERMGEIMGMSTNAVKVALHRGRRSLKGALEKQNSDLIGGRTS